MGDSDFQTVGSSLDAGAKAITFASGVKRVKHFANGFSHKVLWQFSPIFGPVSFHDAQLGLIKAEDKAIVFPELTQWLPH